MSPPVNIHDTMGALFIGMVLATSLHGMAVVQAFYYYRHQNDKWPVVTLVTAVMFFDTFHQGSITHLLYTYLVTDTANPGALEDLVPSLSIQTLINGITAFLVQSFMTARVWRLSDKNWLITAVIALFVAADFVTVFVFSVWEMFLHEYSQLIVLKPLSLAVNVLTVICDLLIAGALGTLLHFSRTGHKSTETIINRLIIFAVNTGFLTSLFALASLITYLALPGTLVYVLFYFCMGRLYSNSLLATLNARKMIRRSGRENKTTTLSLSDLSKDETSDNACDLAIRIDTTKEFVSPDQSQYDKYETSKSNALSTFEERSVNV